MILRQNKNEAMCSMLYYTLKYKILITKPLKIIFFLSSHTYGHVDSVNAIIERFVNKKTIWAPCEWLTLVETSGSY